MAQITTDCGANAELLAESPGNAREIRRTASSWCPVKFTDSNDNGAGSKTLLELKSIDPISPLSFIDPQRPLVHTLMRLKDVQPFRRGQAWSESTELKASMVTDIEQPMRDQNPQCLESELKTKWLCLTFSTYQMFSVLLMGRRNLKVTGQAAKIMHLGTPPNHGLPNSKVTNPDIERLASTSWRASTPYFPILRYHI